MCGIALMEEPVQALFLDEPVGGTGLGLRIVQGGIQALIFPGISTAPQSVIGLGGLQARAEATTPVYRACGETSGPGHPPPSPYLELSRP